MSNLLKKIFMLFGILMIIGLFLPKINLAVQTDSAGFITNDAGRRYSDKDVAGWTTTSDWFSDSYESAWNPMIYLGKKLSFYSGTGSSATISAKGAFCVGHINTKVDSRTYYTITNIVDVDTASVTNKNVAAGNSDWAGWPGGVISYGLNNNNVYWSTSNTGAAAAVKLAYLSAFSTANQETSGGTYKAAIQYTVLKNATSLRDGIGLNSWFAATKDSYINTDAVTRAESYLNTVRAYNFSEMPTSTEPVVNISNGNSYIGPYKVAHSQGSFQSAEVISTDGSNTRYGVKGISTSIGGGVQGINSISSGNEFYIVVNGEISKQVKVNLTKNFQGYKARMYFLYGGTNNQNLMIYRGEPTTLYNTITLRTAKPKPSFAKLKVIKQDTDTGAKLANVGFKIKNVDKNQYVKRSGSSVSYVAEAQAETIYTNSSGEFLVENLAPGKYQVYEVVNPNPGYLASLANPNPASVTLTAGLQSTVTIKNPYQIGDFELEKVDEQDESIKLEGVEFTLKCTSGYYKDKYVGKDSSGNAEYSDKEVTLKTGSDGKININNIWVGTYELTETNNPNYGYVINSLDTTVTIKSREKTSVKITNKKKYVKVEGYVWDDKPYNDGKETLRNDLYKNNNYDVNDVQLEGITVRIKSKTTGQEVAESTTTKKDDTTGQVKYILEGVEVDNIADYYVEFEYDGLIYTSVEKLNVDKQNGSKAKEVEAKRNELDQKFTTVEASTVNSVKTKDSNGNQAYEIYYDKDENNHMSNLREDNKCNLIATTEEAGYTLTYERETGKKKDVISDVNLGLYRREQTDLALMQDMEEVKLEIKGYSHIYKYASRFDTDGKPNEDTWNMGVRFTDGYTGKVYQRALYKADAEYDNSEHKADNLKLTMTYKIALRNEKEFPARINSVVNYYDNRYTIERVGNTLQDGIVTNDVAKGEVRIQTNANGTVDSQKYNEKYNEIEIDTSKILIQPNDVQYIYIQFSVNNESILNILNLPDGNEEAKSKKYLDSIVEIKSYTSYYRDSQKVRAAVDVDSVPGNATPEKINTYEDDTDGAPSIELTLSPQKRQISGTVFEDEDPTKTLKQGETRQGDGKYDVENEKGIAGVKVQIIEANKDGSIKHETDANGVELKDEAGNPIDLVAKIYDEATKSWKPAEYTTKSGTEGGKDITGNYLISGFLPSNYVIKYIWGNGAYKIVGGTQIKYENMVESYKSTVFVDEANREKTLDEKGNTINIKGQSYKRTTERYSDALDDYELRQKIDNSFNKAQITIGTKQEQGYNHSVNLNEIEKQKMNSYTKHMNFGIEYDDTDSSHISYNKNSIDYSSIKYDVIAKPYVVKYVDFGIIERPRQVVNIDKKITALKLTLANGQTLVDATLDQNGVLKGTYLTNVGPTFDTQGKLINKGFVKMEIDSELMQGANLEISYKLNVVNKSEVDYNSKEFYYYGRKTGDIVKITPSYIVDYLDEKSIFKQGDEVNEKYNWKQLTLNQLQAGKEYAGLVSNSVAIGEDIKHVQIYYTDYMKQKNIKLAPMDKEKTEYKNPGNSSVEIVVNKVLSTSEDANFDNQAEIVLVNKDGGSKLYSTPGNYIPNQTNQEYDDFTAPEVIVTPSTGEDRNYTLPMITLIVSLTLLGIGVYLIIAKIIKKDLR